MRFEVRRTSWKKPGFGAIKNEVEDGEDYDDYDYNWHIDFKTLEELLKWQQEVGKEIILRKLKDGNPTIEIYDDYRE
ncbi:hypothetical protein LQZ19_08775 [Treponema primitia]|uniref:hypothetical protein n=1 Tax=Treponema primitia TaxID=88058 RepID=UPI0039818382